MSDTRHKDVSWTLTGMSSDVAKMAVLMDIRDELQNLNRILNCRNFIDMPRVLRQIRANTTRRKRK